MSQNRREFLKRATTLATITAVPMLPGCILPPYDVGPPVNDEWEDRAAELEALTWTVDDPGPHNPDPHLPVVDYDAESRTVRVKVPHVMEPDHWITTVYIRDQDGVVLELREYPAPKASEESPDVEFSLYDTTTEVVAYAYCNLHDNWAVPRRTGA